VHHRPARVVAMITPWNFPLAMISKKLSAAIGADCTIVAKPAEATPLTCIALWHLLEKLDFPAGKLNLVIGSPAPIGDCMCTHPAVRLVSFTGSTATGALLMSKASKQVKRMGMELGGNAPYIIFDDADVNGAADALVANKFRCAGQTCVCANRIYVQRGVSKTFLQAIADRVVKINVGNGLDPRTDIGPLINRKGWDKVNRHVNDALQQGAQRIAGEQTEAPRGEWGNFYTPTVLAQTTPTMLLSKEETFGPVIAIEEFAGEDEAIQLANGTPFGLASYVFTRDAERARRVTSQLEFGHVAINSGQGPTPEAPFGGMKQSGFGREGGIEGLLEYCEPQTVARA
jgi:succinate-semialdehyde dehydrogenase/glutarate-semialdehyde dehydrogenase